MQSRFLPAWTIKKEEELSIKQTNQQNFGYFAEMYISECQELEDFITTQYRIKRVCQDFAHLPIKKVTKSRVKHWILNLKNKNNNEPLGNNSRQKYLGVFRGVFRQAVEDDVIDRNIINDIEFNKKSIQRDLEEIQPFEPSEVALLLQTSKSCNYGKYMYPYLSLAFSQGLSPSEILGLQISDIDFNERTISISRDVSRGKVKGTKNHFCKREIPLFDMSISILKELVKEAKANKTIWLFSDSTGSHLYDILTIRGYRTMITADGKVQRKNNKWYKLIDDCRIKYRHIKNTRHTFAVKMIELSSSSNNNITFQGIADILGHGSLKMIQEHYAKWIKGKSKKINLSLDIYNDDAN